MNNSSKRGITLIALIITVIVLLILAGTAISITTNGGNLLSKTKEARDSWNESVETEITGINSIINMINEYGTNQATYTVYSLGQEVTVGGESFFVIEENDTANKDTIKLITKYNLNLSSNSQQNAIWQSTGIAFATNPYGDDYGQGYWYEQGENSETKYPLDLNGEVSNTERATVYNKAVAYGTAKGGEGRLLTLEEADSLAESGKIPGIIYGIDYTTNPTTDNYLYYYLGTAAYGNQVYVVSGFSENTYSTGFDGNYYEREEFYGVRPVLIISKSLISN